MKRPKTAIFELLTLLAILRKSDFTCGGYPWLLCRLSKPSLREKSLLVPKTFVRATAPCDGQRGLHDPPSAAAGCETAAFLDTAQPHDTRSALRRQTGIQSHLTAPSLSVRQLAAREAMTADRTSAPSTLHMREKVQAPKGLGKKPTCIRNVIS